MKYLLLGLIKIYQLIPRMHHYKCKFRPTCSNYSIIAIREYGSIKGIYLTIKRLLRCNPWNKGGYDPVPKKENLNEKN